MKLWRLITENADGTPLLGFRLAGPLFILTASLLLLRAFLL